MNHFDIDVHRALSQLDDPRCGIALKRNTAIDLVTALIDFLDQTETDPDLEPSLGSPEVTSEHLSAGIRWWDKVGDQTGWAQGVGAMEEETADAEDAGGGDVQDEPHDGDLDLWEGEVGEDMEPSLGSPEIGPTAQYVYADRTGNISVFTAGGSQERWANGTPGASDMEEEAVNEDGEEAAL